MSIYPIENGGIDGGIKFASEVFTGAHQSIKVFALHNGGIGRSPVNIAQVITAKFEVGIIDQDSLKKRFIGHHGMAIVLDNIWMGLYKVVDIFDAETVQSMPLGTSVAPKARVKGSVEPPKSNFCPKATAFEPQPRVPINGTIELTKQPLELSRYCIVAKPVPLKAKMSIPIPLSFRGSIGRKIFDEPIVLS